MSVGVARDTSGSQVRKSLQNTDLRQGLLGLRCEQLNGEAETKENTRRIDELHDALSKLAPKMGVGQEFFGAAAKKKINPIKRVPKHDSLGRKIKNAVRNFGEKLLNLFKQNNKYSKEEMLEPFLGVVDKAIDEADRAKPFSEYFYADSSFANVVEPTVEEYPILFKSITKRALRQSKDFNLEEPAVKHFMQTFAALSSNNIYDKSNFNHKLGDERFQKIKTLVAGYLELALEDANFTKVISESKSRLRSAIPGIIKATVLHAKEQYPDKKEFEEKLVEYMTKLDEYFLKLAQRINMQGDPDEMKAALSDTGVDPDDIETLVLNQVNNFINEAQNQNINQAETNLREFLKHNKLFMDKVRDDLVELSTTMLKYFQGDHIHKPERTLSGTFIDDETDSVYSFEDKFADVAEIIYSLMTYEAISREKSKKLVEWAFSETADVKREKKDLQKGARLFVANPQDSEVKSKFFANKAKTIYMYLMESFNFDSGKIKSINIEPLTKLMNATREAQKKAK